MEKKSQITRCPFCHGTLAFVYHMGGYRIEKCRSCGTGLVNPMPGSAELAKFYDGFLFSADSSNLPVVSRSSKLLYSALGFDTGRHVEMLDVGGGGGFFSKAFEDFGYGKSTYIDLDAQACAFAEEKLGVSTAINADVTTFTFNKKFDFILCRHLIEHLINPDDFILKMAELLNEKGILLIICPNGSSLEYFSYPGMGLRKRVRIIKDSNSMSTLRVLYRLFFGDILHGIDPPRHLWAITPKGLGLFFARTMLAHTVYSKNLSDPCYSPYYVPRSFLDKLSVFLGDNFFSKLYGGAHLVAIVKRVSNREDVLLPSQCSS